MRGDTMQRCIVLLALIFAAILPTSAQERVEHGDWISQFLDGRGEASTHENGMSMLGMMCGDGSCRYYFANGLDCEPSANYPLMLTSDVGALALDAVCEPVSTANGDVMLYWFTETPYLNEAFAKTPVVGIAFPLANGEFRTSKFSMNGFTEAIERMVNVMREGKAEESVQEDDAQEPAQKESAQESTQEEAPQQPTQKEAAQESTQEEAAQESTQDENAQESTQEEPVPTDPLPDQT